MLDLAKVGIGGLFRWYTREGKEVNSGDNVSVSLCSKGESLGRRAVAGS